MSFNLIKNKYFLLNLGNLLFLRIVSRVLPLIMQGYLIRSTGILSFGGLGFAKSIGYCFTAIIGYGTYYAVPKYIALLKDDEYYKFNIGKLLWSRLLMQLFLTFLCFVIYLFLISFIPTIRDVADFLFFFTFVAMASAMFPIGFFQGINKMYIVSIINPLTKVIIYICVFVYIKTPEDAIKYPIIFAVAEIIRLILSLGILCFIFKIPLVQPSLTIIKHQIKDSWANFCFTFYMLFYTHFPLIFLGILVNKEAVAVYKVGDRLASIVKDLLEPFLQSLYPIMNKLFKENMYEAFSLAKKIILSNFVFMGFLSIICYLYATEFVNLLCGKGINQGFLTKSVEVLKVHSILPVLITTSSMLGLQVLTPLKKGISYSIILGFSGLLAMVLHFKLVPIYSSLGAAYAILIGESLTFFLVLCFSVFYKKTINLK